VETPNTAPNSPWYLPPVARRDDVADHGHREHDQPAAAESLQRPEGDQLDHALAEPAEHGTDEEDHDRALERPLAAVEIAELAVQRPGDRRREQVGRHDPREVLQAAEVARGAWASAVGATALMTRRSRTV
jgi:hypothetical protein